MKRIQYRIASAAEFTSKNPVLAKDEIGIERDTGKEKIGDGSTAWTGLAYFADTATDPTKVLKSGDTMTGDLSMGGTKKVTNLANGMAPGDAVNKGQLDTKVDKVPSTDNTLPRFDGTGGAMQTSAVTVADDTTLSGVKEILVQAENNPSNGGGGSIRTAGSRYTLVLKPRNADATYADASEFYYDSTYVGWWCESKMGCSGDFSVNASAYIGGTASADPVLRVKSQDGRTPYLLLHSVGAQDLYMGWTRGDVTRFYFRVTQDSFAIRSADDSGNIWGSAPYGEVFSIDRTNGRVRLGGHTSGAYTAGLEFGTSGPRNMVGTGSPEGAVAAPPGSEWRQTDDSALTYLRWYKATGTGNTGWLPDFEGRWVSYTPTIGGNWTKGNGTATGQYTRRGRTVHVRAELLVGSTTTYGVSCALSLPSGCSSAQEAAINIQYSDTGSNGYQGAGYIGGGWLNCLVMGTTGAYNALSSTNPFPWASGDFVKATATYEIA